MQLGNTLLWLLIDWLFDINTDGHQHRMVNVHLFLSTNLPHQMVRVHLLTEHQFTLPTTQTYHHLVFASLVQILI